MTMCITIWREEDGTYSGTMNGHVAERMTIDDMKREINKALADFMY